MECFFVTNMEVFEFGKNLGSFNYMDHSIYDENCLGYLVEFENMIYQILVNTNNVLLDPEGEAIPFAPSLDDVKSSLIKKSKEPLKIETRTVDPDYFDTPSEFHKINYEVLNEYMQHKIETNSLFDDNEAEIPKRDKGGDSGPTLNNFLDFNRPW